jgi:hypothetical protein
LGACFVAAVTFARGGIFPKLARLWTNASGCARTQG